VEGVDAHGAAFTREATFVVASNISRYGGDVQLSPNAVPGDDLLDLTLFTGCKPQEVLRFAVDIALGRIRVKRIANVEQFTVRSLTARALGATPVDVQVDGDHVGTTPAAIGPVLGRVLIVVPD
jgi:diacylglycerol kinase family enzyme